MINEEDPLAYLRGEVPSAEEGFKKEILPRFVWVFLEASEPPAGAGTSEKEKRTGSSLSPLSKQAMGGALSLKAELGIRLAGIFMKRNSEVPEETPFYGLDEVRIFPLGDPYSPRRISERLYDFLSPQGPGVFVYPPSRLSMDIAPRLAQRFQTGLVTDVQSFFWNPATGHLEMSHLVFLGRLVETVTTSAGKSPMLVLKENAFGEASPEKKEPSPVVWVEP